jgi:hypothetical protein
MLVTVLRPIPGHGVGDVLEVEPSRQVRALIEQGRLVAGDARPAREKSEPVEEKRGPGRPRKVDPSLADG